MTKEQELELYEEFQNEFNFTDIDYEFGKNLLSFKIFLLRKSFDEFKRCFKPIFRTKNKR